MPSRVSVPQHDLPAAERGERPRWAEGMGLTADAFARVRHALRRSELAAALAGVANDVRRQGADADVARWFDRAAAIHGGGDRAPARLLALAYLATECERQSGLRLDPGGDGVVRALVRVAQAVLTPVLEMGVVPPLEGLVAIEADTLGRCLAPGLVLGRTIATPFADLDQPSGAARSAWRRLKQWARLEPSAPVLVRAEDRFSPARLRALLDAEERGHATESAGQAAKRATASVIAGHWVRQRRLG